MKRVLVAEEEPGIELYLGQDKAEAAYQFTYAVGFAEAVKLVSEKDAHFDFLVTDIMLHPFQGRDLANRMVGPHPGIKVLFMGKQPPRLLRSLGPLPRSAPFLHKPFAASHLIKSLDELGLKSFSWLDSILSPDEGSRSSS